MASRLLGCMVGSSLVVACGRSLPHSDTHLNRDDERDTSDTGATVIRVTWPLREASFFTGTQTMRRGTLYC